MISKNQNFLKRETLVFAKNYDFKFQIAEKFVGAEMRLNLNLIELIHLQEKNASNIRSLIRQSIHEMKVNILIFEHKHSKIFNNRFKNGKIFVTNKNLMNKTLKLTSHIS